jgi:hypothetical protein
MTDSDNYDAIFQSSTVPDPLAQMPMSQAPQAQAQLPPPTYDEMAALLDTICENQQLITAQLERILDAMMVPENDSVIKIIEEHLQPIVDDAAAIKAAVGA